MRTTRNLIIALAALVLLYVGAYWICARDRRDEIAESRPYRLSDLGTPRQIIFFPAAELDLRMTFDRDVRKVFAGHWVSDIPGEFVTISENGCCSFRLGEWDYSGKLVINRGTVSCRALHEYQGLSYLFIFKLVVTEESLSMGARIAVIEDPTGHEYREDLERLLPPAPKSH